jgi:hypothetical protein
LTWIGFSGFISYQNYQKQQTKLNELISKFEIVNKQLDSTEGHALKGVWQD